MPNGSSVGTDSAPGQSPVRFDQIDLADVDSIQFSVSGAVDFAPGCTIPPNANCAPNGPDGENAADGTRTALPGNGISNLRAPLNALIGVFLSDERPDLSAAPADLDFRDTGLTRNFQSLSPALKQTFFIGDGLTSGAVRQTFFVPAGATRLFLGSLDSAGWADNSGRFQVQVACDSGAPDRDCDGIDDAFDLCPDWAWSAEVDTDGNGIGNQCECGDQNGDGRVNVIDLVAINTAIFNPSQVTVLCDTNEDGLCNVVDIVGANLKIFGAPAWCSRFPEPDIVLSLVDTDAVGVGRPTDLRVTLTDPAPAGGITVTVTSDDPTSLAVAAPGSVDIPAGANEATIGLEGLQVGTIVLRAEAPGLRGDALAVRVTFDFISLVSGLSVAPGNTVSLPVSLSRPAPLGGVTVALSSNDPAKATVSPSSVFIPGGLQIPAANPQITGVNFGVARISASAPGYASATVDVNVTLTLSFSPATRTIPLGTSSDLALLLSGPAPAGGLTINLSSDNPLVASVPASVFVGAGQTSAPVSVNGVAVGSTTLRASAPGISETTASITVSTAPSISISPRTIGEDLEESTTASLGTPAPAGNLEVTITSADPTRLLLSNSATAAGSASITRQVSAGSSVIGTFYVQALAGAGTVNVVATAPGYADGVGVMTLVPSGFIINTPASISTTTLSVNTNVQLAVARLSPTTLNYAQIQQLRPGLTVNVPLTSSDTNVGVITTSPVVFNGGDSTVTTQFDPLAAGTTTLALGSAPGFVTPNNFQSITATVSGAGITLGARTVGDDLEESTTGTLGAPAPAGGVTVTISSADPARALLATDATSPGSASITRTVATGTAISAFFVHALDDSGSVNIVASAPGYADGVAAITLVPSGFIINSPSSISTTTFAANTNVQITPARLNPTTLTYVQNQQLRGGLSVNVPVTSSDPSVGVITTSPLLFNGGTSSVNTQFDPLATGTSTLAVSPPPGFDTPGSFQSIQATVTAPQARVNNGTAITVGLDLQDSVNVTLQSAPPGPVDVTVTSSSGAIATLSANGTLVGGNSVTFSNVTSTTAGTIWVQGRSLGSTTLTATAAGYSDGTASVTVNPSGFTVNSPSSISTTTFAANSNVQIASSRLNPTTLAYAQNQPVRGGLSVSVPVTSSDPNVGVITTSPLVFNGGTGTVSTQFDPLAAGSTTLAPGPVPGFSTPTTFQSIPATVTAPQARVNNNSPVTVGLDLQDGVLVTLQSAPPSPVDVTVTSSSGAIATLSANGTLVGGNSVTFSNVTSTSVGTVYVQGRSLGSTTLTVTAAGYTDGTASVSVQPSAFIINSPSSITTTTSAANTNVQIASARLNPTTLNWAQNQPVRGGLSVNVSVTSSNPAVGVITTSPVTFNGGVGTISTQFDPLAVGSSTLEVVQPPGFSTPSNFRSIPATVNP
jgi:hypothetical protein